MRDEIGLIAAERERIKAEYQRRAIEINDDLYAPWQPAEVFSRTMRTRTAAKMLRAAKVFPGAGDQCVEIGFGSLGWLGDLISWGVRTADLHGIELDTTRAQRGKENLPSADLRVGDATSLPWPDKTFHLVIASTVFTSILNADVRRLVADEITRVLVPGGALLWYDFAFDNPRNPHVSKVSRKELTELFPQLRGEIRSITLAPPLARFLTAKSWVLATILEAIPLLRTHLIAVLIKK